MAEPLLDLSTLAPKRETVKIITNEDDPNGKLYELATPDDLSIADNQWLMDRAEDFYKLGSKPEAELSDQERLESDLLLDKAATLALIDAPPEAINALPRPAKWRLIAVFLIPFAEKLAPIAQAVRGTKLEGLMKSLPTGENSPPA